MRKLMLAGLMALALQGCASSPTAANASDEMASLKLFDANSSPQFVVDLACSGRTAREARQCLTVSNAFYAWANARHIRLHAAQSSEASFGPASSADAMRLGKAYRIAIGFQPFSTATVLPGTGGDYVPGEVGYTAEIDVFDARSGALVRKSALHQRQDVPDRANVTTFIKADAYSVIAGLDPAYSP